MHADAILDRSNELSEIRGKLWCWKPDQALPDADDVDVTYYADELKRARELIKKLDPPDNSSSTRTLTRTSTASTSRASSARTSLND